MSWRIDRRQRGEQQRGTMQAPISARNDRCRSASTGPDESRGGPPAAPARGRDRRETASGEVTLSGAVPRLGHVVRPGADVDGASGSVDSSQGRLTGSPDHRRTWPIVVAHPRPGRLRWRTKKLSASATGATTSTRTATPSRPRRSPRSTTPRLGGRLDPVSGIDLRPASRRFVPGPRLRHPVPPPGDPGCGVARRVRTGLHSPDQYRPTWRRSQRDRAGRPSTLKEYLPVRDPRGARTSRLSPRARRLSDSLVHLQWARYPLPAAGTAALDVPFPRGVRSSQRADLRRLRPDRRTAGSSPRSLSRSPSLRRAPTPPGSPCRPRT